MAREKSKKLIIYMSREEIMTSEESCYKLISKMLQSYQSGYSSLYKCYTLDKGERLLVDDYILMAVDLLLHKILSSGTPLAKDIGVATRLVEHGIERSVYNYDLYLRGV